MLNLFWLLHQMITRLFLILLVPRHRGRLHLAVVVAVAVDVRQLVLVLDIDCKTRDIDHSLLGLFGIGLVCTK